MSLPRTVDPLRVRRDRPAHRRHVDVEHRREGPDRERHEVGGVGRPPVRRRREVGRVGLDEQLLQRHGGEGVAQAPGVLEGHRAGEAEQVAALDAGPRHRQVAGEAVQHRVLGRALLLEDPQHVVVGVAVVDLQREPEPLGEVDVPAEGLLLRRHPFRAGPEVVEPGLPDDADPVVGREALDLVTSLRKPTLRLEPGDLVGVQGDSAEQLRVPVDGVDREADAVEVAADLDEPGHPDRPGSGDRLGHVEGLVALPGDVEVDVVVDDVDREPVRRGLREAASARRRAAHAPAGVSPSPVSRTGQAGPLVGDDLLGVELGEDAGRLGDRRTDAAPDAAPSAGVAE